MKFIAINGSPRKTKNTATILARALDGAKSVCPDAEVGMVHLYDIKFTGCRSCFGCKINDEQHHGVKCFWKDDLSPILDEVSQCDGLIMGTPIYLGLYTGEFHSFLERLLFAYSTYDLSWRTTAPKRMPTALVYTMNLPEEIGSKEYAHSFDMMEWIIGNVFTTPEKLSVYNTYQFDDYSRYSCEKFNEEDKRKYRDEHWPIDMQNAFDLGALIAKRRLEQIENESK